MRLGDIGWRSRGGDQCQAWLLRWTLTKREPYIFSERSCEEVLRGKKEVGCEKGDGTMGLLGC